MARADILNIMYSREMSPLEFKFESLWMPSMYNYLTIQDIEQLRRIATSCRYASKIDLKYKAIDDIMRPRGFTKFHCGTNRIVYKYLEDESFLVKIALDRVGLGDNPREYRNQFLLKPFVTKTFQVSPCGTVAFVERVQPITSREEFASVGGEIFELLSNCIIGKYVLEDIGSKYFMNYGLRNGFGPVLLDYPYVFKLDGSKLYCNKTLPTGIMCNGEIDYDTGFNNLRCTKCGKIYLAQELESSIEDNLILMKGKGDLGMKVRIMKGDQVVSEIDTTKESKVIRPPRSMKERGKIRVSLGDKIQEESDNRFNINENPKQNHNNRSKNDSKQSNERSNKKYNNNNSKFQNRKNNQNSSKKNMFKDYYKEEETKNNVKEEIDFSYRNKLKEERKIVEDKKKDKIDSLYIEKLKEEQKLLDAKKEIKESSENKDKEMYEAFGITEEDFEEPKEEATNEDKEDIMSQY